MSRIKHVSHEPNVFPGSGVTLMFCVSDIGLKSLLKCQKLRKITMNRVITHNPAKHNISLEGVKALLLGLPKLEYIYFGSLGKLLQDRDLLDHKSQLNLTYYCEMDPNFVDIHSLEQRCPNIQHIYISDPILLTETPSLGGSGGLCDGILNALADSNLPLRAVELHNFPSGETFKNFLRKKGPNIEELHFRAREDFHSEHLAFIGEHCPALQKLVIKECGVEANPVIVSSLLRGKNLFSKLKHLQLAGRMWNPNVVLPLLLSAATDIEHVHLQNMNYRLSLDGAFLHLWQFNKMNRLSYLNLCSGCLMTLGTIKFLAMSCPKLTSFSFVQYEFDVADAANFQKALKAKNLDIVLNCLEFIS